MGSVDRPDQAACQPSPSDEQRRAIRGVLCWVRRVEEAPLLTALDIGDEGRPVVPFPVLAGRVEGSAVPTVIAGQGVERLTADSLESRRLVRGDGGGILGGRDWRPSDGQRRTGS